METPHTLNMTGGDGELAIPEGDSNFDKRVRFHELLHVAHSPVEPPRPVAREGNLPVIGTRALLIAEEFRINSILRHRLGYDMLEDWEFEKGVLQSQLDAIKFQKDPTAIFAAIDMMIVLLPLIPPVDQFAPSGPLQIMDSQNWLFRHIDSVVKDTEDPIQKMWLKSFKTILQNALYEVTNVFERPLLTLQRSNIVPSWDKVIKLADYLDRFHRTEEAMMKAVAKAANMAGEDHGDLEPLVNKHYNKGTKELDKLLELASRGNAGDIPKTGTQPSKNVEGVEVNEAVKWGKMSVEKPKLTEKLKGKFRTKSKKRSSDQGVAPIYVHRFLTDGKVFGIKRMEPAVSILLDMSGSMGYSENEIREMVELLPGAIVAGYAGGNDSGTLKIIAEDGKWTKDIWLKEGGNTVDLPALEWLAEQEEPRIWVSDGQVVPSRGDMLDAAEECRIFCLQNKINLVPNAPAALEVLKGERVLMR